ncbi:TetR/AcrR family transcriptional regulator [Granulicoccus sp. GXG6511]|uniref:TetR/AcrR family transcriptional regulator n=1 Tax=Granulicoccus sp. GXG6511 TaxID=3381351 RepID=UPI003D7E0C8F
MATARERHHALQRERILDVARAHLARDGAAQLSLRKVIADVGMVSSAIHRYFPTRDDLLTALLLESYRNLGSALARVTDEDPAARFRALAHAFIEWALEHPQEFALLYGTPVAHYRAPGDTIELAGAVVRPFLVAIADGYRAGQISAPEELVEPLYAQSSAMTAAVGLDMPPGIAIRGVDAFAHLVGALVLHLGGHFVGTFEPFAPLADRLTLGTSRTAGFADGATLPGIATP